MNSLDTDIANSPGYLRPFARQPLKQGPAGLLFDGEWCGHGEEKFRVYDIADGDNYTFHVQLPNTETEELLPKAIKAIPVPAGKEIVIYDTKKHPASLYSTAEFVDQVPQYLENSICEKCSQQAFKLAVGFEVPEDSETPDDSTWFSLATECVHCGHKVILYEDETG